LFCFATKRRGSGMLETIDRILLDGGDGAVASIIVCVLVAMAAALLEK